METFAELLSIADALVLSVACCLLLEELLFGGLVRLFFAPKPKSSEKSSTERKQEGDRTCLF